MMRGMQRASDRLLGKLGQKLASALHMQRSRYKPHAHLDFGKLRQTLQPGDVLLVEGNARISGAIKYLTQSTWSHAAFYVGDALVNSRDDEANLRLVEVKLHEGCVASPLEDYQGFNLRICRAKALSDQDRATIVAFMIGKLGLNYDLRNIFDLLRYFLPTPPLPSQFRRRALAFGSGDPTRAICSSLIAQAFQTINYPILPDVSENTVTDAARREIFHIRHYSLFAPRDFDLSPYFEVVKPDLEAGFDYHKFVWD
tara:strand:+ start:119 stop:886 length:768 start_codon:yes stop_codon:yes gene_type:complete